MVGQEAETGQGRNEQPQQLFGRSERSGESRGDSRAGTDLLRKEELLERTVAVVRDGSLLLTAVEGVRCCSSSAWDLTRGAIRISAMLLPAPLAVRGC